MACFFFLYKYTHKDLLSRSCGYGDSSDGGDGGVGGCNSSSITNPVACWCAYSRIHPQINFNIYKFMWWWLLLLWFVLVCLVSHDIVCFIRSFVRLPNNINVNQRKSKDTHTSKSKSNTHTCKREKRNFIAQVNERTRAHFVRSSSFWAILVIHFVCSACVCVSKLAYECMSECWRLRFSIQQKKNSMIALLLICFL